MKKAWLRVLAALFCWMSLFCYSAQAESGLEIHFLDVGQADAAIIQCDGETMMIDGGDAGDSSLVYAYLMRTLGVGYIKAMIATHPHADHIGGLSGALNACTVGTVYSSVTQYDSEAFSSLLKYAQRQGISITVPQPGDTFTLGSDVVEFLAPQRSHGSVNDLSLVVRIDYGETSFLFTGDAEWDSEHAMVDSGCELSATLLKVGHHGSDTSSGYVFLREVMPQYAVISVGADNTYGHPADAVLSRLRDAGATVYRTDLHGTIICHSDGQTLTFETEREGKVAEEEATVPATAPYIGNRNSKKFHYAECSSVDDMKEKNKVEFATRQEAIDAGYVPCKRCDP